MLFIVHKFGSSSAALVNTKSKHAYSQEGFCIVQTSADYFLTWAGDIPNCFGFFSNFCCCSILFSGVLEALTWLLCGYFPHRAAGAAVSSSTHPKALTGIQAASSLVQQFQLHSDQASTTHTVWTVSVGLHSKEVEVKWTCHFQFFVLLSFFVLVR